uniref:UBA domain-containing protein n=1 Tax=Florenciella parvula TaxID=236787 RepID=A0A7S2CY40_9STRA
MARFGGGVAAPSPASTSPYGAGGGAGAANPPPAADPMDEDAEMQKALAMSMAMANEGKTDGGDAMAAEPTGASEGAASASASAGADAMDVEGKEGEGKDAGGAEEPNMVLPPVDTAMMNEVVAMGFPEVRVRKALMAGSSNAEAVINWCVEHGEDGDIDDPIPLVAEASGTVGGGGGGGDGTVKSYKCNETGRLFACMADVELYAEKTGRSDFSECTEEKKPRTAEELARDKARLKERIAQKRRERGVEEKEV